MDIDLLSKMVKELILDNDKVVLPGLGAFVAEIVPSTFSDKGYTINPPYRRLSFRARPDEGTALAELYSSANNVSFDVADKIIRDFVSELKTVIHTRKTVVFPGLGRLRATKENAVFFVADEELDIYPEGFGLEPISLKTQVETCEQVATVMKELKSIVEEPAVAETVAEAVAEVAPEPVAEPVASETEASADLMPGPVAEPAAKANVLEEIAPAAKKNVWKTVGKVVGWMILSALLLLGAFVAVSRLFPHSLDTILYTPEELEIINTL